MDASVACIAGEEVYRQWQAGSISGRSLPARKTPFGLSAELFRVEGGHGGYYLLPRHGLGMHKTAPGGIRHRANLYALKDLGVRAIVAWGPGAAVRHSIAVGDVVVLSDLIDFSGRNVTFFENNPLGFLRQMPVFCRVLTGALLDAMSDVKLVHQTAGVAAVTGGPRFETPAEVRMLSTLGADVVTHYFAPDAFLAKELELCYTAVCYVVNYAETGSRHRPFATGELFGGLAQRTDAQRLGAAVGAMGPVMEALAARLHGRTVDCECLHMMDDYRVRHNLPADWRKWFDLPGAQP